MVSYLWSVGYYGGKAQVQATTFASGKLRNQKQSCIPGRVTEIIATTVEVKEVGVLIPTIYPDYSPAWPVQKTDGSWKMKVDYCKLNQVVNPNYSCCARCGFIA